MFSFNQYCKSVEMKFGVLFVVFSVVFASPQCSWGLFQKPSTPNPEVLKIWKLGTEIEQALFSPSGRLIASLTSKKVQVIETDSQRPFASSELDIDNFIFLNETTILGNRAANWVIWNFDDKSKTTFTINQMRRLGLPDR